MHSLVPLPCVVRAIHWPRTHRLSKIRVNGRDKRGALVTYYGLIAKEWFEGPKESRVQKQLRNLRFRLVGRVLTSSSVGVETEKRSICDEPRAF